MKYFFNILLLVVLLVTGCSQPGFKIYVSPNGDDNNAGKSSEPVKTLDKAAELAKAQAGKQRVTIYLDDGTFQLTEPLVLGKEHSGTEEAPVVWKAHKGAKPVISGGIQVTEWKQENNGTWVGPAPSCCFKLSFPLCKWQASNQSTISKQ